MLLGFSLFCLERTSEPVVYCTFHLYSSNACVIESLIPDSLKFIVGEEVDGSLSEFFVHEHAIAQVSYYIP
jgi:hypothetical protein